MALATGALQRHVEQPQRRLVALRDPQRLHRQEPGVDHRRRRQSRPPGRPPPRRRGLGRPPRVTTAAGRCGSSRPPRTRGGPEPGRRTAAGVRRDRCASSDDGGAPSAGRTRARAIGPGRGARAPRSSDRSASTAASAEPPPETIAHRASQDAASARVARFAPDCSEARRCSSADSNCIAATS